MTNDNHTPLEQMAGIPQAKQITAGVALRTKKDAAIQAVLARRGITEFEPQKLAAGLYPDGSERYVYAGEPLIMFKAALVEVKTDEGEFTIIQTIQYEELKNG